MEKVTAVEQFIEQLEEQGSSWENVSIGRIQISIKVEDYLELIKQAKEMEKEQIEKAFEIGYDNGACVQEGNAIYHGCNYYNETFGKEEIIVTEYKDGTIQVEKFKNK